MRALSTVATLWRAAWLAAAATFAVGLAAAATAEAGPVPLVTFYSSARTEHITTSDPAWTCTYFHTCAGSPPAGYQAVGLQGHVYDPALPQPAGTVTLYRWWSSVRSDYFLTADPAWAGSVGAFRSEGGANYTLTRIEGFIPTSGSITQPILRTYWNGSLSDNATVAVGHEGPLAGYGVVRNEGYLLLPDSATASLARCQANVAPSKMDPAAWLARANFIDQWIQPWGFMSGDTVRLSAPNENYTFDYWGHTYPTRGYSWSMAPAGFPAPGDTFRALIVRVTTGRMFVPGRGWFEANQWVRGLGEHEDWDGPCLFYDATGVAPGELQVSFNDDNLGDNSGGANLRVELWY